MHFDEQEYTAGLRDVNEINRDALVASDALAGVGIDLSSMSVVTAKRRSSKWRSVREQHLKEHPRCEACGDDKNLEVHHLKPYHLFPELELEKSNLMTLCCHGIGGMNCHLVYGHCGAWVAYNPDPVTACYQFREMLKRRKS
jgi:5-methylcytosine-specific restriction enzyme A